jgi:hypothetical protein
MTNERVRDINKKTNMVTRCAVTLNLGQGAAGYVAVSSQKNCGGIHLRVPRFLAYQPPRPHGPVLADKPGFSQFPLPAESSPEISALQRCSFGRYAGYGSNRPLFLF